MKQWLLRITDADGREIFRHIYPGRLLFQPFFMAIGKALRNQGASVDEAYQLDYLLWPAAKAWDNQPPLAPDYRSALRGSTSSVPAVQSADPEKHFFLVVLHQDCVLYSGYYRPSSGIDQAIARKLEELRQTHHLDCSVYAQLYYHLAMVEISDHVLPAAQHLVDYRSLPGWSTQHTRYLQRVYHERNQNHLQIQPQNRPDH